MILTLGALVVLHRRWLARRRPRARSRSRWCSPPASPRSGVAFGAWALAAVARARRRARGRPARAKLLRRRSLAARWLGIAAVVLLIAAWPTWAHLSAALRVAQEIASTSNSGNLHAPLRRSRCSACGCGAATSCAPAGAALTATHVADRDRARVGAARRRSSAARPRVCAGRVARADAARLARGQRVRHHVGRREDARTHSPAVVLLAWGGVGALMALPRPRVVRPVGCAARARARRRGAGLRRAPVPRLQPRADGALRRARLARTSRFAGRGPTLFTDFDEYSLYELRDLDVGGPDFVYPPPALAAAPPAATATRSNWTGCRRGAAAYPLIVTRRDPPRAARRPPTRWLWQGSYYQVWGRRPGALAAVAHVALAGCASARQCACRCAGRQQLAALGRRCAADRRRKRPRSCTVSLARSAHPAALGTRAPRARDEHTGAAVGGVRRTRCRAVGRVGAGPAHAAPSSSASTATRSPRSPASSTATRSCPTASRRSRCAWAREPIA